MKFNVLAYFLNLHRDKTDTGYFQMYVEDADARHLESFLLPGDKGLYPYKLWIKQELIDNINPTYFRPGSQVLMQFDGELLERERSKVVYEQQRGFQRGGAQPEGREFSFGEATYVVHAVQEVKTAEPVKPGK